MPPVTNFPKTAYHAGTQNWDIAQGAQGRLLFANNEGLLIFDGAHWQRFPIANGTCVRSIAIAPDGRIYVGGQGEIGFFSPDVQGDCRISRSTTGLLKKTNNLLTCGTSLLQTTALSVFAAMSDYFN